MKPTLLVLAAGMGSRYGGLKQMDPMGPNGETVLDYSVYDAIRAGFGRVVFIIREDFAEEFKKHVGAKFAGKIEVDYCFQRLEDLPYGHSVPEGRVKPWGTTHAIRAARDVVREPFAVVNADDFYGRDAYVRVAEFFRGLSAEESQKAMAMVGYPLENTLSDHGTVNRGICQVNGSKELAGVEEYLNIEREADGVCRGQALDGKRKDITTGTPVSMNFWAFTPSFFSQLEIAFKNFLEAFGDEQKSECYIPTVVDDLIHSGKAHCKVLDTTSPWFGVTYPDDKPFVVESIKKLIDAGEYPAKLS